MIFSIKKKTTIFTPDRHLKIFDVRGVIFYNSKWVKNFKGYLTLPHGEYSTENNIYISNKRKNTYIPKLHNYERNLGHDFSEFEIKFESNPNKCTINHDKKTIIFDNSFENAPRFQLVFILEHEKGHKFYKTEHKADHYAIRKMLQMGYTPIQILYAPLLTLSGRSYDRKRRVFDTILKKYRS